MKKLIAIIIAAVLVNLASGVKYGEEDVYDDYDIEERSNSEPMDEVYEPPKYDLKDALNLFIEFVHDYNKEYKTEEDYMQHYMNFVKNLKEIIENNKNNPGSVSTINMFADLSDEEIASLSG